MGKIVEIGDQYLQLEIAEGVKVKVQRTTIGSLMPKGTIKKVYITGRCFIINIFIHHIFVKFNKTFSYIFFENTILIKNKQKNQTNISE